MNDGALTEYLDRAAEINILIDHLPITPVIPVERLVYGVSLNSIDQIISFDRFDGGLMISARGRVDLSIARIPVVGADGRNLGITLGQRWDRGFLSGLRQLASIPGRFPHNADPAMADLLLFHLELLACAEAASTRSDQSRGERILWREIQDRVTGIWRELYGQVSGHSFRSVALGKGEGEIWKALMAYYLPEIHDLMTMARAGSGPEEIRVHLVAVEGFEVRDFGGVFFERSLADGWNPAQDTVEFEGHPHEVRVILTDRVVGTSRFGEFLERIMALPEPLMRLKAFFSMILEYGAFGGEVRH